MEIKSVFPEAKARRVVAAAVNGYAEACERGRVGGTVAAGLIGTSRARLSSLKKEAKDQGPNVSVSLFLALLEGKQRILRALESGDLPAAGVRGAPQDAIVPILTGDSPGTDKQPELELED